MDNLIFRLAEDKEIAAAATLRWKWVIDENEGVPVVARDEFISIYIRWARNVTPRHTRAISP